MRKARFRDTTIVAVDFSHTKGLKEVDHLGPSGVATSTLDVTARSLTGGTGLEGEVETFFRNAGVSKRHLQYFRENIRRPNLYYTCFISYSHVDKDFGLRLYKQLHERGIECTWDEHISPGDKIIDALADAIRRSDKVLLCCSESSLTSTWVEDEISIAIERERKEKSIVLIPLDLDGYLLREWVSGHAPRIRERFAPDFTNWEHDDAKFEGQFERVVMALRSDQEAREVPPKVKL